MAVFSSTTCLFGRSCNRIGRGALPPARGACPVDCRRRRFHARRWGRRGGRRRGAVAMPVVALRDSEEIEDWRVRQMVDVCGLYFGELWSRGNLAVADDICDAAFVHTDSIWNPSRLVAGPSAMKAFVRDTRAAYPDLVVRAVEYGTSDADRLFVHWTGSMTNLGRFHGHSATRQNTKVTGVSMMSFTKDRSKLVEVNVFRQPTREEKTEFADREGGFELHLARLHFG